MSEDTSFTTQLQGDNDIRAHVAAMETAYNLARVQFGDLLQPGCEIMMQTPASLLLLLVKELKRLWVIEDHLSDEQRLAFLFAAAAPEDRNLEVAGFHVPGVVVIDKQADTIEYLDAEEVQRRLDAEDHST